MPDFAVKTAFNAVDRISPAFREMSKNSDKFSKQASRHLDRVNRSAFSLAGAFRSLLPAIGVATILKFANDSIDAWNKQEAAVANVEAGLRSTNNAIGLTSKQLQEMASSAQAVGIFGDEDILQSVTAQLLTFGKIGKQNFDRVQMAVTDVTAKLKGVEATSSDLQSTSIMLGKALEDPSRGMGALRRVGISFSNEEERKIKLLQQSGKLLDAQNLMLGAIERQYGGTNEALRQTNAGMERAAKNTMGDTMEEIGKQLVPLRQTFFEFAVWLLPKINTLLPVLTGFLREMSPVIAAVAAGFLLYKTYLMLAAGWQKIMIAAGWIQYLWMMRSAIFKAVTMTKTWTGVQWALNAALNANPIGVIIMAVAALAAGVKFLYDNWDAVGTSVDVILAEWKKGIADVKFQFVDLQHKFGFATDEERKKSMIDAMVSREMLSRAKKREEQAWAGESPNESAVELQQVKFSGELNINGAPAGSTARSDTRGARPVNMNLVGVNP